MVGHAPRLGSANLAAGRRGRFFATAPGQQETRRRRVAMSLAKAEPPCSSVVPHAASDGDSVIRVIDCSDLRDCYEHIRDRLGQDYTDVEMLGWIDSKFLLSKNYSLKLITDHGAFAVKRHRENWKDRGDAASISSKEKSVETFSIRQEWRSPPWLVQHENVENDAEVQSLHWGTLFDGTESGWRKDHAKVKKMIQLAVNTIIQHCRLYSRNITKGAARFLVGWGNLKNDDCTTIIIMAVWRSTCDIEPAWARHKNLKCLDKDQHGSAVLDTEKLELANNMSNGYTWAFYTEYERCNTFYKQAQRHECSPLLSNA